MTFYGTLSEAQDYFESRLHSELWDESSVQDRQKAMATATRMIDQLSFVGEKATAYAERQNADDPDCPTSDELTAIRAAGLTQELEFPRGTDTDVPTEIEHACYELAFSMLDGRSAEKELEDLATISQGYSAVRRTRDRSFAHEHLLAGIPSQLAWGFLRPYLRDSKNLRMNRV